MKRTQRKFALDETQSLVLDGFLLLGKVSAENSYE